MSRMIATRIWSGIVVLFVVATFSHFLLRCADGGPFDQERAIPQDMRRNLEKAFHLDGTPLQQYGRYLAELVPNPSNDWIPNLGISIKQRRPVWDIITESFPYSVLLGAVAMGFAVFWGLGLGVLAASKRNTRYDYGAMGIALLGISIPSFVLGPVLILGLSLYAGWLPPARMDGGAHLVLPGVTLGLFYAGVIARLTRSGMLNVLPADYIRTARAKGVAPLRIFVKHALRLGLLPVVAYLGPATASLICGSFVVEKIFDIPGLGFYFVEAVATRDYALLSGVMVFYSAVMVLVNLLVDISAGYLDPRLRVPDH